MERWRWDEAQDRQRTGEKKVEHFNEVLNQPDPEKELHINNDNIEELGMNCDKVTVEEVKIY